MNRAILIGTLGLIALGLIVWGLKNVDHDTPPNTQSTSGLNDTQMIKGVSLTPLEVTEDSRCAKNVQCVWAGTVKVRINISNSGGNSTEIIELGKPFNIGAEIATLESVSPYPEKAGEKIPPSDYQFKFVASPKDDGMGENPGTGGCYVGGCSGQLCTSDYGGAISTCEYTAAYACYQTAKCERQANGQCGWTPSAALQMCLSNAK